MSRYAIVGCVRCGGYSRVKEGDDGCKKCGGQTNVIRYVKPVYQIENESGLWFSGEAWGCRQSSMGFDSVDDLPERIDDLEILIVDSLDDWKPEIFYCDGEDTVAGVKVMEKPA